MQVFREFTRIFKPLRVIRGTPALAGGAREESVLHGPSRQKRESRNLLDKKAVELPGVADSRETYVDFFLQHGIDWIIAIQSLGGWLELPMRFFTFLGYENFFFLIMILWIGLGEIFPPGEAFIPLTLRYIRYSLVGLWVMAGAPWLFFHFKLAGKPKL